MTIKVGKLHKGLGSSSGLLIPNHIDLCMETNWKQMYCLFDTGYYCSHFMMLVTALSSLPTCFKPKRGQYCIEEATVFSFKTNS